MLSRKRERSTRDGERDVKEDDDEDEEEKKEEVPRMVGGIRFIPMDPIDPALLVASHIVDPFGYTPMPAMTAGGVKKGPSSKYRGGTAQDEYVHQSSVMLDGSRISIAADGARRPAVPEYFHNVSRRVDLSIGYATLRAARLRAPVHPLDEELWTSDGVELSPSQHSAMVAVAEGQSILLTGAAGTGKTQVLKMIIKWCIANKRPVVVCGATAIAAAALADPSVDSIAEDIETDPVTGKVKRNKPPKAELQARSMRKPHTLHAALGIVGVSSCASGCKPVKNWPLKDCLKAAVSTGNAVIIVDEVSMLLDSVLRAADTQVQPLVPPSTAVRYGIGGVQTVLCGDFCQLPPVVKRSYDERNSEAPLLCTSEYLTSVVESVVELREVHRQSNRAFVDALNAVRLGDVKPHHIDVFRECVSTVFDPKLTMRIFSMWKDASAAEASMRDTEPVVSLPPWGGIMMETTKGKPVKRAASRGGNYYTVTITLSDPSAAEVKSAVKAGIRSRFIRHVDTSTRVPESVVKVHHAYMARTVPPPSMMWGAGATHPVGPEDGADVGLRTREALADASLVESVRHRLVDLLRERLPTSAEVLHVGIGTRVRCIHNYSKTVYNGCLGTVVGYDTAGLPEVSAVTAKSTEDELKFKGVTRTNVGAPIVKLDGDSGTRVSMRYVRHSFPLSVHHTKGQMLHAEVRYIPWLRAHTSTIHRVQGLTLDRVEAGTEDTFPGGCYVALSRARSADKLSLRSFNPSKILAHSDAVMFYKTLAGFESNVVPVVDIVRKAFGWRVGLPAEIPAEIPSCGGGAL